jgi:hypothetical protein
MVKNVQARFLDKEVKKARDRFNKVFGNRTVCNLQARYAAILSICWLGVLSRKIIKAQGKEGSGNLMKEFNDARNSLRRFFERVESSYGSERREKNANAINQTFRKQAYQ